MCWKKEYIRLMTLFEVIVEIDAEQILIPSRLPSKVMSDPFLMGSESMVRMGMPLWGCDPVGGTVVGVGGARSLGLLGWAMSGVSSPMVHPVSAIIQLNAEIVA